MKKHVVILLLSITASLFSLTSCSNTTEAEESSSAVTTEVSTPEPTATPTPEPTSTPVPTSTPTPESADKSVDEIAAEESYTLSEQEKADLRALGATEEQINNVKSGQDFVDLVYSLVDSGSGTSNSSNTGDSSSEDSFFDVAPEDRLPTTPLDDPSTAPAGRM